MTSKVISRGACCAVVLVCWFAPTARADAVAQWHFDEAPGETVAQDSIDAHPGTLFGSAAFEAGGIAGNCLHLTMAGSGYVDFGDIFHFTSGDFAIVAWAKTAAGDTTINYTVVAKHRATLVQGYFLGINYNEGGYGATNKAWFYQSCYPPNAPVSTTSVNDGVWHQLVAVYRAGHYARLFVDGAPYESSKPAVTIVGNTAHLAVGAMDRNGQLRPYFTGWVDEVQLYDHMLVPEQIDYLYAHPDETVIGPLGDMNCDDIVSFGDINPFVLALANPAAYEQAYPDCPRLHADLNYDGEVSFGDINPFVLLLSE